MQYNTCHNQNHKVDHNYIIDFSTGLHKFEGIDTKFEFEFKFKLNLNCKLKKIETKKTVTIVGWVLERNQVRYEKLARPTWVHGTGRRPE
jgi:hypothetical protein